MTWKGGEIWFRVLPFYFLFLQLVFVVLESNIGLLIFLDTSVFFELHVNSVRDLPEVLIKINTSSLINCSFYKKKSPNVSVDLPVYFFFGLLFVCGMLDFSYS